MDKKCKKVGFFFNLVEPDRLIHQINSLLPYSIVMRLEQVQDMSLLHFLNDVLTTIKVLCLYSQMINTQQYTCNKIRIFH